jgi:hypothetical protein
MITGYFLRGVRLVVVTVIVTVELAACGVNVVVE